MNKLNSRFASLKFKLIAYFIVLSLVPIIILGFISYGILNRILEERVSTASMNIALSKINSFDISCKNKEAILANLNNSSATQQYIKFRNQKDEERLNEGYDNTLLLLGSELDSVINNGDVISSVSFLWNDGYYPMIRGVSFFDYTSDYRKSKIYLDTIDSTYKTVWEFVDNTEKERYICITKPIVNVYRGDIEGIAMLTLFVGYMDDMFSTTRLESGERNIVIDKRGNVVFDSSNQAIDNIYDKDLVDRLVYNNGHFKYLLNGENYNITYVTSEVTGWRLINFIPFKNISRDIMKLSQTALFVNLICIFYAIIVSIFVHSRIYKPIRMITKSIKRFGEGELDVTLPNTRKDEIGLLIRCFNNMTVRIKDLIANVEKEQKLQKETEIRFLQAQITPHFLYNTLTSIKALARLNRTKDISKMIVALINLLRMVNSKKDMVTIVDEINYVDNYVAIMKYRYGKYFDIKFEIDADTENFTIPKLTLQPLVENCIIHAFYNTSSQYMINIKSYKEEDYLVIEVSDNGIGMNKETVAILLEKSDEISNAKFNKIGLYNINDRIKLNFGEKYGIFFKSSQGNGTTVYIHLPLLKAEEFN